MMNCDLSSVAISTLIKFFLVRATSSQEESTWYNHTGSICKDSIAHGQLDSVHAIFFDKSLNDFFNLTEHTPELLMNLLLNLFVVSDGKSLYRLVGQVHDEDGSDWNDPSALNPLEVSAKHISFNHTELFQPSIPIEQLRSVYKYNENCHFECFVDWRQTPRRTYVTRYCASCPYESKFVKQIDGLPIFIVDKDGGKLLAIQENDFRLTYQTYELENFTLIRQYTEPASDYAPTETLETAPEYLIPFAANESIGIHRDGTFTTHTFEPLSLTLKGLLFPKSQRARIYYCSGQSALTLNCILMSFCFLVILLPLHSDCATSRHCIVI